MRFGAKLQEMNLTRDPFEEHILNRRPRQLHASPLIRALGIGADHFMLVHARDVFFVTYLSTHLIEAGIDFHDRLDLGRQIRRESGDDENENQ
jgi:hypothetical protein